jgi:hypothetical protein
MKSHHEDTPVSRLRRRLLCGLPSGLVLATPLSLLGCGGGGDADSSDAPPPAAAGGLRDPGRAFAGSIGYSETVVDIDVPPGVAVPDGGLAVYTALGGFGPVSGMRATVRHMLSTAQWTTLFTAEGLPLLFGYVGGGMTTLSAHSTAVALLAVAMGAEFSGGSTNAAWIDELRASPAAGDFASAIAAALVVDPYAVATMSTPIGDALLAAIRELLPSLHPARPARERVRPLGVTVNPPNASSGVQPIVGDTINTIYLQNEKLRRAHYVIKREAHTPSDADELPDAARPLVASGDVPMLPGFDGAGSIIGSVALAHYAADSSGLAFSRTPDTAIPVTPGDAKRTRYSVTVLTAGNAVLSYDPEVYAKLSDDEKKMIDITLFAPENLALRQLFIDVLVPLFLTWLGGKIGDEAKGLGPREYKEKIEAAVFGQILSAFQSTLPNIAAKIRDPKTYPDYGVGGALHEIVRSHLIDFVDVPIPGRAQPLSIPTLSKFSISMVLLLLKYLAYEKMSVANGEALLNFLDGDANELGESLYEWQPGKDKNGKTPKPIQFNKENFAFAGMGVATKCLTLVDDALNLLSKTRMLADMATSRLLEGWQVSVIQAKVRLRPNPFEVDVSGTYALTAEIVDNDDDVYGNEKGSFSFDWVCSARAGDLYKRGDSSEINRFTTSNNNATVDYVPRGAEPEAGVAETISVTAYFEPIGASKPRELVGTFSVPVRFKKMFNLTIAPASDCDVPADSTIGVSAAVKEALPKDATVDWEWSHAGVGALRSGPVDANPSESSALLDSGSTEGGAVVTVRAKVNLPAGANTPPRSVFTDPVSATLRVKKGLKTLTLQGSWTQDVKYTPFLCGRCGPGGSNIELIAYWVSAYLVIPKVSGAKGYSVLVEKATPDPLHAIPYPHSRTLDPARPGAGWEDRGGAWWNGLSAGGGSDINDGHGIGPYYSLNSSRFGDLKITVTVTLP